MLKNISCHQIIMKQDKGSQIKKKKGFTLLEILIVLAILGVMAAALIPSIKSAMNKSHDTQLVMNLTTLDSAAKVYEMEKGMAPQSVDELVKGKYAPDKDYGGITLDSAENGGTGCVFSGTLSSGETVRSSELGKKGGHGGTDA